jgi:hypothetical protein
MVVILHVFLFPIVAMKLVVLICCMSFACGLMQKRHGKCKRHLIRIWSFYIITCFSHLSEGSTNLQGFFFLNLIFFLILSFSLFQPPPKINRPVVILHPRLVFPQLWSNDFTRRRTLLHVRWPVNWVSYYGYNELFMCELKTQLLLTRWPLNPYWMWSNCFFPLLGFDISLCIFERKKCSHIPTYLQTIHIELSTLNSIYSGGWSARLQPTTTLFQPI